METQVYLEKLVVVAQLALEYLEPEVLDYFLGLVVLEAGVLDLFLELDQAHTARRVIPIKYSGLPAGDWLVSSIVTFSKLSQPGTYTYLRV